MFRIAVHHHSQHLPMVKCLAPTQLESIHVVPTLAARDIEKSGAQLQEPVLRVEVSPVGAVQHQFVPVSIQYFLLWPEVH